jgi:hypothetical protein
MLRFAQDDSSPLNKTLQFSCVPAEFAGFLAAERFIGNLGRNKKHDPDWLMAESLSDLPFFGAGS